MFCQARIFKFFYRAAAKQSSKPAFPDPADADQTGNVLFPDFIHATLA
jgi:hypothetical protein